MEKSIAGTENRDTKDIMALARVIFAPESADINAYSPLSLAYIGDAVYDLVIRTLIVSKGNTPVNKMHKRSSGFVNAAAQAAMIKALDDCLTKEEQSVYKRGRNAKAVSSAKNASIKDYRSATGFEALVGWLYLTEQFERLFTLIKTGLDRTGDPEDRSKER